MSTPVRIGAFVAGLAVLFGAAFGIGRLFEDEAERYSLQADVDADLDLIALTISDGDGDLVLDYQTRHEKQLHLIAVRKDFGGYQHLHPTLDSSGGWHTEDADLSPGEWRLYADFQAEGAEPAIAYDDISVDGDVLPTSTAPLTSRVVVDGYAVEMHAQDSGSLAFTVSRDQKPVTDLEPYLGAFGHLVVIRESDLDFLHVHPEGGPPGPDISFGVSGSTQGRYRAYFEFQHGGVVRTAAFVLDLGAADQHGGDHGDD